MRAKFVNESRFKGPSRETFRKKVPNYIADVLEAADKFSENHDLTNIVSINRYAVDGYGEVYNVDSYLEIIDFVRDMPAKEQISIPASPGTPEEFVTVEYDIKSVGFSDMLIITKEGEEFNYYRPHYSIESAEDMGMVDEYAKFSYTNEMVRENIEDFSNPKNLVDFRN